MFDFNRNPLEFDWIPFTIEPKSQDRFQKWTKSAMFDFNRNPLELDWIPFTIEPKSQDRFQKWTKSAMFDFNRNPLEFDWIPFTIESWLFGYWKRRLGFDKDGHNSCLNLPDKPGQARLACRTEISPLAARSATSRPRIIANDPFFKSFISLSKGLKFAPVVRRHWFLGFNRRQHPT
jgi:hypothetical protein